MIRYNFGIECDISWNKFLYLETDQSIKTYKKDFKEFSELFYFIDTNKKHISKLLFDGYEYTLENGLLHNLYGPAKIKHTEKEDNKIYYGTSVWFFINGKIVTDKLEYKRGCKKTSTFENGNIFFYEEITNKKSGIQTNGSFYRRKEGIDYQRHFIDLKKLREKDIRKKKLEQINEQDIHNQ